MRSSSLFLTIFLATSAAAADSWSELGFTRPRARPPRHSVLPGTERPRTARFPVRRTNEAFHRQTGLGRESPEANVAMLARFHELHGSIATAQMWAVFVMPSMPWDYKTLDPQFGRAPSEFEEAGNFNYGFTGAAVAGEILGDPGLNDPRTRELARAILLRSAGAVQIGTTALRDVYFAIRNLRNDKPISTGLTHPLANDWPLGAAPFGDDASDQTTIDDAFEHYASAQYIRDFIGYGLPRQNPSIISPRQQRMVETEFQRRRQRAEKELREREDEEAKRRELAAQSLREQERERARQRAAERDAHRPDGAHGQHDWRGEHGGGGDGTWLPPWEIDDGIQTWTGPGEWVQERDIDQ